MKHNDEPHHLKSRKCWETNSLKNRIPVGLYGALRLLRDEINMYRLHRKGIKKAKAYASHRMQSLSKAKPG